MPNISEIITNREKKFKKRNYRSWDLTGSEIDLLLDKKNSDSSNDLVENTEVQKSSENSERISAKTEAKVELNQSQTKAEVETKWSQNRATTKSFLSKTEVKAEPQLEPQLELNQRQKRAKVESKRSQTSINFSSKNEISFLQLSGLQKEIIIFIYNICKNNRTEITDPISIINIANFSKTTVSSAKKAIQRLQEKNLMKRVQFKNGRGGWSTYALTKSIYQEIMRLETQHKLFNPWNQSGAKIETNWSQTEAKIETKPEPQLKPSLSSSSSFLNITTTDLLFDYEFDIHSLEKIGFNKNHLKQITDQNKLDPETIQQSINHFAYDYENQYVGRINSSPLNYFMGILRKGNPYMSEHYVDPQEEKRKQFLEKCRRQKEEKKEIEKELLNTEYNIWMRQLSKNEQEEIAKRELPDHQKPNWFRYIHDMLEKHFQEKIWPEKRQEAYEKADLPFVPLRDIS